VALTRNLKAVMSPIISDYTANEWLKMWQELGKPHPELGLALKMVGAGVKYKQNPQDKRIFLALPQELRPLVREALGLDGESQDAGIRIDRSGYHLGGDFVMGDKIGKDKVTGDKTENY
jgi:hypothetical protein